MARRPLLRVLRTILDAYDSPIVELSLLFVTDAAIRRLHRRDQGVDTATDVLTYPIPDAWGRITMAAIVISLDRAASQAKARRVGLLDEVALLVVHGVLHLAGFDDRREKSWYQMKQAEVDWMWRFMESL